MWGTGVHRLGMRRLGRHSHAQDQGGVLGTVAVFVWVGAEGHAQGYELLNCVDAQGNTGC